MSRRAFPCGVRFVAVLFSFRPMEPAEEFTTVESIFVRHRNALLVRGQFTPIYTDYYLHLMQHGIRPPVELDQMLKDTLAMLVLHLVARHGRKASRGPPICGRRGLTYLSRAVRSKKPSPGEFSPKTSASQIGISSTRKRPLPRASKRGSRR